MLLPALREAFRGMRVEMVLLPPGQSGAMKCTHEETREVRADKFGNYVACTRCGAFASIPAKIITGKGAGQ